MNLPVQYGLKRAIKQSALFALLLAVPSIAVAASGSHGEGGGHGEITDLGIYWVNFAIYTFGLYFILRKKAVSAWTHRRTLIATSLEENSLALKNAESRLVEATAALANVDAEVVALAKSIQADGEKEAAHLIAAARERAERVKKQTSESLVVEEHASREHLRRELAELVLKEAEAQFRAKHSSDKDRELRKTAVSGMNVLLQ